MKNPWAMPWQGKYRGRAGILDDYREGISLGLLRNGVSNLNTTDYRQINASRQALQQLSTLTDVTISSSEYNNVPVGQTWISSAWSGDMAAAQYYMPKHVNVDVIGYWFPADGRGAVNNDTSVVLKSATNPVLAHVQERPVRAAAPGGRGRAVAAGVACREQRHLRRPA